ncbi:hypothetical protein ACP26L_36385 (plasmid) [Paenibacillus sp. S-38]|uniref:hypothetical protein n=1 Tax=Paenibacillus sp. S-38 TaxID=3416710 RepID=UPI003CE8234F
MRVRYSKKKIMWFDADGYTEAIAKVLRNEVRDIKDDLLDGVRAAVEGLEFKDNRVRLGDGSYTNDRERATALLASVLGDDLEVIAGKSIRTAVHAMRDNFEESHIGWYYEYGTGTEQEEPYPIPGFQGTPRNRLKVPGIGTAIVTRSRFINGGQWEDLGGNMRLSYAKRAGTTDAGFLKYIDGETPANYWFRDTITYMRLNFRKRLNRAILSVRFRDYIKMIPGGVFTLGKK